MIIMQIVNLIFIPKEISIKFVYISADIFGACKPIHRILRNSCEIRLNKDNLMRIVRTILSTIDQY